MNKNKTVKKKSTGFWRELKGKLRDSKDSFIDHQNDLFMSIRQAKFTTKLILGTIIVVVLIMGSISVVNSINNINEKKQILATLQQQIEEQEKANQKIEDELKGNLDAYIEEQARLRLDMVYPDEQIYINMAG